MWTLADTAAARYLMQVTLVRALSVFTDKYHTVAHHKKSEHETRFQGESAV